ncbi:DUF5065 domain-containing protein (plasmid) [Bacillus mycoides]|uniref:DUF5065 domain-containing protein n=1 Tax=Bacillus mycoides TaxID=1405 RepID=A0A1W6AIV9_BACMY|nr:DUF5065 family protein [Bacillus mycoides]ARJ25774.1 DUF5065 domain-containing protein [Bacillus mycoides]
MKLGKLVLIGTLALGSVTAVGAFDAKPAAAATSVQKAAVTQDDWGIINTHILYEYIQPMPAEYKKHIMSRYKTGNIFTVVTDWSSSLTANDQVKIFLVLDDGQLARIKTINWTNEFDYSANKQIAVFQTQITDAYGPGKYVAVSYIHGKHLRSDFFTINQ